MKRISMKKIKDVLKLRYIVNLSYPKIAISTASGTYTNLLKKYSRFHLLILDDFGISSITNDDATNLFEIIEDRSDLNSTIITS